MEIRIRTHEELRTDRVTIEITGTGAEVREVAEDWEAKLYTDGEVANLQASEAELVAGPLRRRIAELERALAASVKRETDLETQVQGYDRDRHTERDRADRERQRASELKDRLSSSEELVQEERIRGNNLAERLARAEKALAESRELVAFKDTVIQSTNEDFTAELERSAHFRKRAEEAESKLIEGHVCTGGCSGNQHVAFVGRQALTRMENQVAELTRRIDNARVILSEPKVTGALNRVVRDQHESSVMALAIEKALDTLA